MKPMDEVIAVHGLAQTVWLVPKIGCEGRQPNVPRSYVDRETLALVAVVAERYSGEPYGAPVPIHLAIEQAGVLELGADVSVGYASGHLQLPAADPVRIFYQPRLHYRPGYQQDVAESSGRSDLSIRLHPVGPGRVEQLSTSMAVGLGTDLTFEPPPISGRIIECLAQMSNQRGSPGRFRGVGHGEHPCRVGSPERADHGRGILDLTSRD
jgi:hypothetical protein